MAIRRKRTSIVAPTACSLRSDQGKHLALILDGVDRGFESGTDGALAITEPNTETGMTDYQRVSGRPVQFLQHAPFLRPSVRRVVQGADQVKGEGLGLARHGNLIESRQPAGDSIAVGDVHCLGSL